MSPAFGEVFRDPQLPFHFEIPGTEAPRKTLSTSCSLHDRVAEIALIAETLETIDVDDVTPELRAQLEAELKDAITGTRDKIDRTSAVLANFEAAELAADAEIARLAKRKERLAKQRQRLEGYVISVLVEAGVPAFDGHTSTLTVKKTPPALVIEPGAVIPADYLRTPEPPPPPVAVPDKNAIKAAMKKGMEIAGCRLAQALKLVRT